MTVPDFCSCPSSSDQYTASISCSYPSYSLPLLSPESWSCTSPCLLLLCRRVYTELLFPARTIPVPVYSSCLSFWLLLLCLILSLLLYTAQVSSSCPCSCIQYLPPTVSRSNHDSWIQLLSLDHILAPLFSSCIRISSQLLFYAPVPTPVYSSAPASGCIQCIHATHIACFYHGPAPVYSYCIQLLSPVLVYSSCLLLLYSTIYDLKMFTNTVSIK